MSFPEINPGHDPILNKTEKILMKFSWMAFPGIDLIGVREICQ